MRVDDTLKTEASVRTLPLIPQIEKMLKEKLKLEMQYSQILKGDFDRTFDGFVCRDNTGTLITPEYVTSISKMWSRSISSVRCVSMICIIAVQVSCLRTAYP